jgi:predicted dinucleotide-binding enzyme
VRIGILGSGNIGGTLAALWAGAGHGIVLANRRGPESRRGQVAELGADARAATIDEVGFDAVDAGALADGRRQEPGTPVYNQPLTAPRARAALSR